MQAKGNELAALRRAALNDPRNGELRYLLGAEMAQQQDYHGAVLEMSAALALNPQLHVARFQLGLLHLTLAQPQHTLAVLAPLAELDDSSPLRHFKSGLEALIQNDFPQCLRALERGVELNHENPPLNRDMTMIIERVKATMAAQQPTPASVNSTAARDPATPRTDFSLYGPTRH